MKNLFCTTKKVFRTKAIKILFVTTILVAFLIGKVDAQDKEIPLIGSIAPSFTAESTNGEITFPEDFGKSWKILFSHPQDFTPVCTTELLELAYMQSEFKKLGVKIAVISVDNIRKHKMWKNHLENIDFQNRGLQTIHFPIFEDPNAKSSIKYGMIHRPSSTSKDVRGVFVIDSNNIIRSINFYPIKIGRNMKEIVRIVEALQTIDQEEHVATPVNWEQGDDILLLYKPYSQKQYKLNPGKYDDQYYTLDDMIWFRKAEETVNE